jgi:hypothetical protein
MRPIGLVAGIAILVGCAADSPTRVPELSAEELTASGWEAFEGGHLSEAQPLFGAAAEQDSMYADAILGIAWCELGLAANGNDFLEAYDAFVTAIGRGASEVEARAGMAAVLLALSHRRLPAAADEARAARGLEPEFVFVHRPSFDWKDLLLIEAFAEAGCGNPSAAIAAADQIQPSGIREEAPETWTVDLIRKPTFVEAVLAYLQKMSTQEGG